MQNARMDEAQAEIKTAWRNIINQICRWHHPMAESKEELKSLLVKVQEESEKPNIQKN